MAVFFPQGSLTMQDVKKKKKDRQLQLLKSLLIYLLFQTHTSLSLSLLCSTKQFLSCMQSKKISYILTKPDTRWSQRIASNTKLFIVAQKLHNWLQLKGDSEMLFILTGSVIYFKQLQY